jgi:SOS-response transcriptional repressor LexA
MTSIDEQILDELLGLVGAELARRDSALEWQSERLLRWLAADMQLGARRHQASADTQAADAFAERHAARFRILKVERALPLRELRYRGAPVIATVAQSMSLAREERCATMLELAAAAGAGRELWDEPCDTWVELPVDAPDSPCVALRVAGDSMTPVLHPGDVILVGLHVTPRVGDLVVTRLADDGVVVKQLAASSRTRLELASLNPGYPPLTLRRDRATVIGTVIARFSRP